jgi:SNF2 family DNA or RNA helicase
MIELWKHQQRVVDFAKTHKNFAVFADPGTGKTGAVIRALCEDYNKHRTVRNTLILSPLSVCAQWAREFGRFSKMPPERVHVLTDVGAKRTKAVERIIESCKGAVIVTNYEGLQIKAFYAALLKWQPQILVLDESHRVKDAAAVRSKCAQRLAECADRKIVMTGTPILNSLLDLFGQYRVMDPSIFGESFWRFRQTHFYDANAGMPSHVHFPRWLPRPEAATNIARVLASTSVQAKKEECLDLPPLLKVPVHVEMGVAQRRAYDMMKRHFVAELGDKVATAEFAMTKTLRMQQILAGFIQDDDTSEPHWFDDVPRLDAFKELIESIGDRKVIVWTTFQPTYSKLAEVLEKMGKTYAYLTGLQSNAKKALSVEDFCRGETQVLISNPAAGGTGINLQEAPFSIYYMRGYSLEHYIQSEARNYRGGSEMHDKITHYELEVPGTLDAVIGGALKSKQAVGEAVLKWAKGVDTSV